MTSKDPITLIFLESTVQDLSSYIGAPVLLDDEPAGYATNPRIEGTMLYVDMIPSPGTTGDEIMCRIYRGQRVTLDLSGRGP